MKFCVLTTSGILGVTTETSVTFVFYFIAFGVVYAAIGGGRLFIDLSIRLVGRATGGSQKVAVIGSSLMGTITGSAVANVAAVGVFTIPADEAIGRSGRARSCDGSHCLDRRTAYATGDGRRGLRHGRAAWCSLFADRTWPELFRQSPTMSRFISLSISMRARPAPARCRHRRSMTSIRCCRGCISWLPPILLIVCMIFNYSAQSAAMYATVSCFPVAFLRKADWFGPGRVLEMIRDTGQAGGGNRCSDRRHRHHHRHRHSIELRVEVLCRSYLFRWRHACRFANPDHYRLHHHGHGAADCRRLHHRRGALRAGVAEARRAATQRAFLRDVLLRAVDGDAASGASSLCCCRACADQPVDDGLDRVPDELCRVSHSVCLRCRPGAAVSGPAHQRASSHRSACLCQLGFGQSD